MVEKPTYGSMWPILAEEGSDLMVKVLRDMIAGEVISIGISVLHLLNPTSCLATNFHPSEPL